MSHSEQQNYSDIEADQSDGSCDSYDSEKDPDFETLEESRSRFSGLSIRRRKSKLGSAEGEGEPEVVYPELDDKDDQKGYETIQKAIQAGQLEKLKIYQCKVYLKKHGLRLTGNKETLIQRIREHLDIISGGGEENYPASSFIVNCKGDACTGDIVLFEQNVYEMFNIASRSASGPPCGTRLVAGRIVKESYGAAKQQHTFTIEVLWSKGEKPLPPLHPLLIKGRNLYRLTTKRQRREDEEERKRILLEKHARGAVARSIREVRVLEREARKTLKAHRVPGKENNASKQKETGNQKQSSLPIPLNNMVQTKQQPEDMQGTERSQTSKMKECGEWRSFKDTTASAPEDPGYVQKFRTESNFPLESHNLSRQPFTSMNGNLPGHPSRMYTHVNQNKLKNAMTTDYYWVATNGRDASHKSVASHLRGPAGSEISRTNPLSCSTKSQSENEIPEQRDFHHGNSGLNPLKKSSSQMYGHGHGQNFDTCRNTVPKHSKETKQLCWYYAQGRCHFGHTRF